MNFWRLRKKSENVVGDITGPTLFDVPPVWPVGFLKLQDSITFFGDRRSCFAVAWTWAPHPSYIPHGGEDVT